MNLAIGSDHAGYQLKEVIKQYLETKNYHIKDFGTFSDESVDYPDFAHPLAEAIKSNSANIGILVCGSGNGVSMAANKHKGVRVALCWRADIAELAKQHNDANIVALPARFISEEEAMNIVDAFLCTDFEGGRHERRVEKIDIEH